MWFPDFFLMNFAIILEWHESQLKLFMGTYLKYSKSLRKFIFMPSQEKTAAKLYVYIFKIIFKHNILFFQRYHLKENCWYFYGIWLTKILFVKLLLFLEYASPIVVYWFDICGSFSKNTSQSELYGNFWILLCILRVTNILLFFSWPTRIEQQNISGAIFNEKQFPGVIGFIDGTHIAIKKPSDNPDSYYNRKDFHSVILQGKKNWSQNV